MGCCAPRVVLRFPSAHVSLTPSPPPAPPTHSTNFNPDPTKDTVTLSSGTATVTTATTTELDLTFTSAPNTGSLDATVTAYGGASSPTEFAYFAGSSGNNVTSCMINDAHTAVNASTCVAASTTVTQPAGIAIANGYAYVASGASGVVSACAISNGTFVGCSTTTVTNAGGATLSAVALNPAGTVLYAADRTNSAILQCSVSATALSSCSVAASTGSVAAMTQPIAIAVESQTAYIADGAITNGLLVCGINGATLGCSRLNMTSVSTPTALTYFANGNASLKRLYVLNSGTNSWAYCDLVASRTLATCTAATSNAYASSGSPSGIAAMPTLAGYTNPTLLLTMGAAVNKNCDTGSTTCVNMAFGYNSAVAIG